METEQLVRYTTFGVIQEFGEIYGSDHRSIILDIDFNKYLDDTTSIIRQPVSCAFTSKQPKAIYYYKQHVYSELQSPQYMKMIEALSSKL